MPQKSSPVPRHLVVELVGPLVDDGGASARTIGRVLADHGVELRPGALDQVVGAAPGWALQTLLEGHGRGDLLDEMDALLGRLVRRWCDEARTVRPAPGALEAWQDLRQVADRSAVLSAFPREVTEALAHAAGLPVFDGDVIDASAEGGPPRSERLAATIAGWGVSPEAVTAVVSTSPAMLAALTARCGEVVLCGEGTPQAALLAERRVATLGGMLGSA
jgi:beta-phosphoglucomutase-like phosphatase (HAD superfamily)